MNDLDEFAVVALAIFVTLTFLIWLLTYLERTLVRPAAEERAPRGVEREEKSVSAAPADKAPEPPR